MKILELTRSFYPSIGGMEKFVHDRLKIYQSLSLEYQVVTTNHSEKRLNSTKRLNFVKYLPSYTPYEIVPSLKRIMNIEYDVLSVNQVGYYYSDYAIRKAYSDGKKIILTPHFYFHTNKYKYIKNLHFNYVLPTIFNKVNRIICFTKHEASYWMEKFPRISKKIVIIPHYFMPPTKIIDSGKNEFGTYLLFLGRGEKNKRIDLLIQAFDKLKSNYHLVLTIDTDEIPFNLRKIVYNNNKIHLLGRVSEKRKQTLLANCAVLVLPTDYEAFGIVNLEASFYKKPILLSELAIFKSILDSNGIIYFENNIQSIYTNLIKFINLSENEKNKMGIINYKNLNRFRMENVLEKYSVIFKELIN